MPSLAPPTLDRQKKPHRIPTAAEQLYNYAGQSTQPSGCLERLALFPLWFFNHDFTPFLESLIERFEFVFRFLEFFFPYFRPQKISFQLNENLFGEVDKRENFLPVRFQTIADQIVATALPESSRSDWSRFCRFCLKRYHHEFLSDTTELNNAFAPFDPDADALYLTTQTKRELEDLRERFFDGIVKLLRDGNFVELPREETDKILRLRRPGSLPIVARLDNFKDVRIFIRGAQPLEPREYSRWLGGFRRVTVDTQLLSRVCVLARIKIKDYDGQEREKIFFKLFKNVLLEDLKMAIPNAQFKFPYLKALFSVLAVSASFSIALVGSAWIIQESLEQIENLRNMISSFAFGSPVSPETALPTPETQNLLNVVADASATTAETVAPGPATSDSATSPELDLIRQIGAYAFILTLPVLICRKIAGFVNQRNRYQKQHSSALYFQTLASNRAATSLLVALAEEQEVKEIVLGYFAASQFPTWATEREIDKVAETWVLDNFDISFDFESDDAIRKLLEKRLLEKREREPGVYEYRAVRMDEALRRLKADWLALEEQEDAEAAALVA